TGAVAPCPPSIRRLPREWWARFALPTLQKRGAGLFRGLTLAARHHGLEAVAHDRFSLADDARDESRAGGDVVDQALHLAGRPDAFIGIAGGVDHLAARAGDEIAD